MKKLNYFQTNIGIFAWKFGIVCPEDNGHQANNCARHISNDDQNCLLHHFLRPPVPPQQHYCHWNPDTSHHQAAQPSQCHQHVWSVCCLANGRSVHCPSWLTLLLSWRWQVKGNCFALEEFWILAHSPSWSLYVCTDQKIFNGHWKNVIIHCIVHNCLLLLCSCHCGYDVAQSGSRLMGSL